VDDLKKDLNLLLRDAGCDPLDDEQYGYEEVTDDEDSKLETQSGESSVIYNLQDTMDSLYKLSPALNFFLETYSPPDPVETVYRGHLIRHMFPVAEPYLIERLTVRMEESRKKLEQPASFETEVRTRSVVHKYVANTG